VHSAFWRAWLPAAPARDQGPSGRRRRPCRRLTSAHVNRQPPDSAARPFPVRSHSLSRRCHGCLPSMASNGARKAFPRPERSEGPYGAAGRGGAARRVGRRGGPRRSSKGLPCAWVNRGCSIRGVPETKAPPSRRCRSETPGHKAAKERDGDRVAPVGRPKLSRMGSVVQAPTWMPDRPTGSCGKSLPWPAQRCPLERIGGRSGDAVTETVALRPALDTLFRHERMAKPFPAGGASSHAPRALTPFARAAPSSPRVLTKVENAVKAEPAGEFARQPSLRAPRGLFLWTCLLAF
jgi:hypothetical protein